MGKCDGEWSHPRESEHELTVARSGMQAQSGERFVVCDVWGRVRSRAGSSVREDCMCLHKRSEAEVFTVIAIAASPIAMCGCSTCRRGHRHMVGGGSALRRHGRREIGCGCELRGSFLGESWL